MMWKHARKGKMWWRLWMRTFLSLIPKKSPLHFIAGSDDIETFGRGDKRISSLHLTMCLVGHQQTMKSFNIPQRLCWMVYLEDTTVQVCLVWFFINIMLLIWCQIFYKIHLFQWYMYVNTCVISMQIIFILLHNLGGWTVETWTDWIIEWCKN